VIFNQFLKTHSALKTYNGMVGQVVRITGSPSENGEAIRLFSEVIMKIEQEYLEKMK